MIRVQRLTSKRIIMRILQVIDSLALGGAEVLVKDVAPRLRNRGVDCEVAVLCSRSSPLESALQAAGVPLHTHRCRKGYIRSGRSVPWRD